MKRLTLIFFLTVFFAVSALAQSGVNIGSPAPLFAGMSITGTQHDLAAMRGSVVVITFWSTRCAVCHTELPKLNRFAEQYRARNVVFLALSMENEEKIAGYLERNSFRFQVLPNSFGVVLQYADRSRAGNLDMGFPSFFVIDQQGFVRYKSSGYDKTGPMAAALDKLLARD